MIVFYDGKCALCGGWVGFLAALDARRRLRFAPLGGATAAGWPLPAGIDSVVFLRDGRVWVKSEAVLRALWDVGGVWRASALFRLVPRPWRDALYDAVARRRAAWSAGRACPVPSADLRSRLLP